MGADLKTIQRIEIVGQLKNIYDINGNRIESILVLKLSDKPKKQD